MKTVPIFIHKTDFDGTILSKNNGLLNIKHIDAGMRRDVRSDNGTIWIGLADIHMRKYYFATVVEHLKKIIKEIDTV